MRNRGVKLNAHNMYIIIRWSPDLKKKGTTYFIYSFSSTFTGHSQQDNKAQNASFSEEILRRQHL
jgi:hypothetical protein